MGLFKSVAQAIAQKQADGTTPQAGAPRGPFGSLLSRFMPQIKEKIASTPAAASNPLMGYSRLTADDVRRMGMKKGGSVKAAKTSSASKRADGIATKGKTRGRII